MTTQQLKTEVERRLSKGIPADLGASWFRINRQRRTCSSFCIFLLHSCQFGQGTNFIYQSQNHQGVCDDAASKTVIESMERLNAVALAHDFLNSEEWVQVLSDVAQRDDLNTKLSGFAAAILSAAMYHQA